MRKIILIAVAAVACTAISVPRASAQSLDVVGLDGKTVAVAPGALERRTVVTQDRGLRTEFQGVALRHVLISAGVPFGDAISAPALARVVTGSAPDGYRVVYAIAVLDAAFTDRIVLVADRRDGRSLLPDSGSLQIIVPNDKGAARWIPQVNKIEARELQ